MIKAMSKYKYSLYNLLISKDDATVVLYNCYSGGIVQLEKEVFDSIRQPDFSLGDVPYGKELLENGYIVNSEIDEFQRVKTRIEHIINNQNQESVSYVVAPTLNCNLRCVYCFQKDFRTEGIANVMTAEMSERIINYIVNSNTDNAQLKRINVNWFGGEPLLCFDLIVSFSKKLKEKLTERNIKYSASMITNGILLDEEKLKILSTECNLERVQITVDGDVSTYCEKKRATPELYKQVIENIRKATNYVKAKVRVNADKKNFHELCKLITDLYESDINKKNFSVHFAQLRDYQNQHAECGDCYNDLDYWLSKEKFYSQLSQYATKYEKNNLPAFSPIPFCGVSRGKNAVIDYLGNLYKCEHYIGDKTKIVGNVTDGLFYNEVYQKSMVLSTDERCKTCDIFPCCNYSQCIAMHGFAGDEEKCKCYDVQLETIKQRVKKYLEVRENENFENK